MQKGAKFFDNFLSNGNAENTFIRKQVRILSLLNEAKVWEIQAGYMYITPKSAAFMQ